MNDGYKSCVSALLNENSVGGCVAREKRSFAVVMRGLIILPVRGTGAWIDGLCDCQDECHWDVTRQRERLTRRW